jgi:ubiquinone/menaquinone biosynthesis C-methylase UbiE
MERVMVGGEGRSEETAILRDWYDNYYSTVFASADGSFFAKYTHTVMELDHGPDKKYNRVLEVGGNRGEHIPFIRHQFSEYVLSDLFEPQLRPELIADPRISTATCDVEDLPFPDNSFDRVVVTCVLHHVDSPLRAVHELRRVAKPGGVITILLPTDPGIAYRTGKALTSGRAAVRAQVKDEFRLFVAIDHRNHFTSILDQGRFAFANDAMSVTYHPFRVPSMNLNALAVINVRKA